MNLVVLGLSLTSAWRNGHAATYRLLLREFAARGHDVVFLERDLPWYAANRDLPFPSFARIMRYRSLAELREAHTSRIRDADAVIIGSFVPEGIAVADWVFRHARGVTAFYDLDPNATLAHLELGSCNYLAAEAIPRFSLFLSTASGPLLQRFEHEFDARGVHPLHRAVDPSTFYPDDRAKTWRCGYLGAYSEGRLAMLQSLLLEPATQLPEEDFAVAGAGYPATVRWPENVERLPDVGPADRRAFFNAQDFTLNLSPSALIPAGHAPDARLFEAAACGTAIISEGWYGIEEFFEPNEEILLLNRSEDVVRVLRETPPERIAAIGQAARRRVLADHTAAHRAAELEGLIGFGRPQPNVVPALLAAVAHRDADAIGAS